MGFGFLERNVKESLKEDGGPAGLVGTGRNGVFVQDGPAGLVWKAQKLGVSAGRPRRARGKAQNLGCFGRIALLTGGHCR